MAGGPDPGTTNTGTARHGTVPVPVAGDAGKVLTVASDESGYSLSFASTELGYAERTTAATTTNTVLGSAASNKISGLSVTVFGQGLPVFVEFFAPQAGHSVSGQVVAALLVINGSTTGGQLGVVPYSATAGSLVLRRRLVLTAGTSYTFEVGTFIDAAGTGTFGGTADAPMHLSVSR